MKELELQTVSSQLSVSDKTKSYVDAIVALQNSYEHIMRASSDYFGTDHMSELLEAYSSLRQAYIKQMAKSIDDRIECANTMTSI